MDIEKYIKVLHSDSGVKQKIDALNHLKVFRDQIKTALEYQSVNNEEHITIDNIDTVINELKSKINKFNTDNINDILCISDIKNKLEQCKTFLPTSSQQIFKVDDANYIDITKDIKSRLLIKQIGDKTKDEDDEDDKDDEDNNDKDVNDENDNDIDDKDDDDIDDKDDSDNDENDDYNKTQDKVSDNEYSDIEDYLNDLCDNDENNSEDDDDIIDSDADNYSDYDSDTKKNNDKIIVLDIETTGCDVKTQKIIQIAYVVCDMDLKPILSESLYINDGRSGDWYILSRFLW